MDFKLKTEFFVIFIFIPALFIVKVLPFVLIMPVLWTLSIYAAWVLKLGFKDIYYLDLKKKELKDIFRKFLFIASFIALFSFVFYPEKLFGFVIEKPLIYLLVFILYPLLSVVPQELIFRKLFFERYGFSVSKELHLWVNAFMFGFIHIVFGNLIAVSFSIIGGYIFANRYKRCKDLFPVYVEHSLYGLFVFTIGLGEFFYLVR